MHKSVKIIAGIAGMLVVIAVGFRIGSVNSKAEKLIIEDYDFGEEAELGENYMYNEEENVEGYTVTATEAKLMTYEEFLKIHKSTEQVSAENKNKMVVAVKLLVKNKNVEDTGQVGLFLASFKLNDRACYLERDQILFALANPTVPDPSWFCIRPETEMMVELPFVFEPGAKLNPVSESRVRKGNFVLTVALEPIQKNLHIEIQ